MGGKTENIADTKASVVSPDTTEASKALRNRKIYDGWKEGRTFSDLAEEANLSPWRIGQIVDEERTKESADVRKLSDVGYDDSIDALRAFVGNRAVNALKNYANCITVADVCRMTRADLRLVPNFGVRSLEAVQNFLATYRDRQPSEGATGELP